MSRKTPTRERSSPVLIRALFNAIQQAVGIDVTPDERQGQFGKRWLINDHRTLTTTESSLYIYVENPTTDMTIDVEGSTFYTNQQITVTVYDEPTLDETTFNSGDFRNTRSSVTKNPPWNLYKGTDNNVTISDKGRLFVEDAIDTGNQSNLGGHFNAPGYMIDPESSALIEISLDTNTDTTISFTTYIHEQVPAPDVTDLQGTN